MPDMTLILIRGKRTATKEEKWHAGKRRKTVRQASPPVPEPSSSGRTTYSQVRAPAKKSRKRVDPSLSRLEQLPTEIIQSIFEYSANVDLPLASPRLASQLASRVLQHQLTSNILQAVIGDPHGTHDLSEAMRLMNCKFFTWPFFKAWLHNHFDRLALQDEWDSSGGGDEGDTRSRETWIWIKLRPPLALPPPSKLLRRPFTSDRVQHLNTMVERYHYEPERLDAVYPELVQDGLQQAVEDGAGNALYALFVLGAQVDTELLRSAVIDSGCQKCLVQKLITRAKHPRHHAPVIVDFLDPILWAWADKARATGDEKGSWLIEQLKFAAQHSGQGGGDVAGK